MFQMMESNEGQNHEPDSNEQIAGYRLLEMIDYGSFGDILKVKDDTKNKIYALKQIKYRGNFHDDPYIINEIYCLTHLKHKNIILMHEIVINDCEIDIVMEYAEHENLERYVVEHDLEFVTKFKIYSQVLQGVEYCHSMGIAHRDITPGNILLTNDLVVKLADFGLAVKCRSDDDSPVLCKDYLGRASYLAPEVLRQKPFNALSSDVWSLGVTLLYLLFHSIPFKGFETEILEDQQRETWKDFTRQKSRERSARLKPSVSAIVARALELEPEARGNVRDLVRQWDAVGPEACFV